MLEGISNQPSTAVPTQIYSSKNGVQADPLHGNRPYYDVILVTGGELEKSNADFFFNECLSTHRPVAQLSPS